ncbi:MAG: ATPase P [Acidobacteriia bacterium]|nr:ATPase P [Terriglobia bacterium]
MKTTPGIEISIPHFAEPLRIERVVSDYTGTLSLGGKLVPGVAERLRKLKRLVEIHVVTADTRGTACKELARVPLTPHILEAGARHDILKKNYAEKLGPSRIAALGNGNNDALLLRAVRDAGGLAIGVDNGEGCSVEAMQSANLFIVNIVNALDLLLDPRRCIATLRK